MTRTVRTYSLDPDTLFRIVKAACRVLGYPIAKEDAESRQIVVSTGWSPLSWGETMDIIVSQQKGEAAVVVNSNPKVWFNITASSRADGNTEALFKEIENQGLSEQNNT